MQTKLLTNRIPYTFVRGGYYYFSRRVPTDLQCHYNYPRIVQGLQTSSPQKARVQANLEAAKLDAYWSQMRLAKSDVIGLSLLKASSTSDRSTAISFPNAEAVLSKSSPTLLDALQVYLDQKGKGRPKTFRLAAERVCNYVIGISGNEVVELFREIDVHLPDSLDFVRVLYGVALLFILPNLFFYSGLLKYSNDTYLLHKFFGIIFYFSLVESGAVTSPKQFINR